MLTIPPNEPFTLSLVREFAVMCGPFMLYTVMCDGQVRLLAATPDVAALLAAVPINLPFSVVRHESPGESEAINILRDCVKAAGGIAEPGVSLKFFTHLPGEVKALRDRNYATLAKLRELAGQLNALLAEGN